MSRVSNAIRMYKLISTKDIISVDDLAILLEVSPRSIRGYKKDLQDAGIDIYTKKGVGGGYYTKEYMLPISLTLNDKSALKLALKILEQKNFIEYERVRNIIVKYLNIEKRDNSLYIKYIKDANEVNEKISKFFPIINESINNKRKLKIIYRALSTRKQSERVIWPLLLFEYLNTIYVIAYCELRKETRSFKLSRIEKIYDEYIGFNYEEEDLIQTIEESYGIIMGELYDVDLIIKYPFNEIVEEKQISHTQIIKRLNKDAISFKASMRGEEEIISWILSMGDKVRVKGSKKLKEKIKEKIKRMQKHYK